MTTEPTAGALPREPLGDPRLLRLVVGQGLAGLVDALFLIWLTLFVLELSEPGIATGLVLVAAALPRAALLLPAGVLVDRLGPAHVVTGASWLRFAVLLALCALVTFTSPSVTAVALLAALLGVADAAYFPAALALLPAVVPTEKLPRVNALVQGAESGAIWSARRWPPESSPRSASTRRSVGSRPWPRWPPSPSIRSSARYGAMKTPGTPLVRTASTVSSPAVHVLSARAWDTPGVNRWCEGCWQPSP